mgnify:CR=1 FL=1
MFLGLDGPTDGTLVLEAPVTSGLIMTSFAKAFAPQRHGINIKQITECLNVAIKSMGYPMWLLVYTRFNRIH